MDSAQAQVQEGRLLPRLRPGGHGARLQPLDQGGRNGARARTRRGQELELLRRDGGEEHRPEGADLSFVARHVDRRQRNGPRRRHGALQWLLPQPQESRIRSRARRRLARRDAKDLHEGRAQDLPAWPGGDDPRARLDQGRDRRRGPRHQGQEFARGPEDRQLLRLHVHAPSAYLSREGRRNGQRVDIQAALHGRSVEGGGRRECRLPA